MLFRPTNSIARRSACAALTAVLLMCSPVFAQFGEEWTVFIDPDTDEACGIVYTTDLELTVIDRTGELVIINGIDTVLDNYYVDTDDTVYYDENPVGRIAFADDADGYPTLFWVTDDDTVVGVDEASGLPYSTGVFPDEIGNTGCDPCDLVDDQSLCTAPITDPPIAGVPSGSPIINIACGSGILPAMIPAFLLLTVTRWARRR